MNDPHLVHTSGEARTDAFVESNGGEDTIFDQFAEPASLILVTVLKNCARQVQCAFALCSLSLHLSLSSFPSLSPYLSRRHPMKSDRRKDLVKRAEALGLQLPNNPLVRLERGGHRVTGVSRIETGACMGRGSIPSTRSLAFLWTAGSDRAWLPFPSFRTT